MSRHALTTCLLAAVSFGSSVRAEDAAKPFRESVVEGKADLRRADADGKADTLLAARTRFEAAVKAAADDAERALALYHLAYTESRLATFHQRVDGKDPMETFLPDAVQHAEDALAKDPAFADTKALLSSLYGMQISREFMLGMSLGPKSSKLAAEAVRDAPSNPRAWIAQGTSKFFTPTMFGGDLDAAIAAFENAVETAAEEKPGELAPAWGRLDAYAWLGQAYERAERFDAAEKVYEEALKIEPNFGWVKYELLPKLKKKLGHDDADPSVEPEVEKDAPGEPPAPTAPAKPESSGGRSRGEPHGAGAPSRPMPCARPAGVTPRTAR